MAKTSVLVVDDEELIRWSLEKELTRSGYSVATAGTGAEALARHQGEPADVILLDINLPDGSGVRLIPELLAMREDTVIIMITSVTSLETAVEAMRLGAWDYVTKPFEFPRLHRSIAKAAERVALRQENRALKARQSGAAFPEVVAESPAMRRVLELAGHVVRSDAATVLLLGESGVGKDLLARRIHEGSPRGERLFLDVNCAGLPEALLESELFGHERGAFTDAKTQKRGLFELAEGGTVYLDEVADAPLVVQAKLLKVLEQRTFRRVGGLRDLAADVRVIAATNRDLGAAVAAGRMREDLYFRLKVFPLEIPPLRERREDVLPLARGFLASFNRAFRKAVPGFEPEAERLLLEYRWPGNVRELRNVIERGMILAPEAVPLGVDLLPAEVTGGASADEAGEAPAGALAQSEARLIREALAACGGNQSRAAAQLGIGRDALRRRLRRLHIATGREDE
ncbi:MAG: sigma-54-dependent Fis family transcriptional regulator [Deltaproteobacteria bacterium]|nr:sigma-54-dependent Fis family transcriptional regulator [Deltaproteobacteria bacterium]